MTMIVGYAPDERGKAALHLAGMLARSADDDLVVGAVVPAPWIPGLAKVDAEYREYLDERPTRRSNGRAELPARRPRDVRLHARALGARRPAGAGRAARRERDRARLVLRTAPSATSRWAASPTGCVHSSPRPACDRAARLPVQAGRAGRRASPRPTAARRARTTSWSPRRRSPPGSAPRCGSPRSRSGARRRTRRARHRRRGRRARRVDRTNERAAAGGARQGRGTCRRSRRAARSVIGRGTSWAEALDDIGWDEGDVLVVGSSSVGPVAHVFLGSRATKILRHSPVPVVVVPRGAAGELAERPRGGASRGAPAQGDPRQRLADDALGDERRAVGGADARLGITSTTSAPTSSSSAATVRTASSRSTAVIPPGSGVPVPGMKAGSSTSTSTVR